MLEALTYLLLTGLLLVLLVLLGPRLGRSTTAPLLPWRVWHGPALWVAAGGVAVVAEAAGQAVGLWSWQDPGLLALHAWWWWASVLVIGLLRLRPLGTARWFVVQLAGTLAFELPQEAVLGWVSHAELLGSPYVTIVAIHVVVTGLAVTVVPAVTVRVGLVRRSWAG